MKKALMYLLLLMTLTAVACGKANKSTDQQKNSVGTTIKDKEAGSKNSADASDGIAPTLEPVPEATLAPTPTPFPTDNIKECDLYLFTFNESTSLYNEPDTDSYVHAELQNRTGVHIVGKYSDKWYLAEASDLTGYVKKSDVAKGKGYINADEVKFRKGASRSSTIINELSQETKVIILSRTDDWYKVMLEDDNTTGYVFCDYVSYHDAYVTADDVRLREAPNTECKTKTRVTQGKKVSVICEYNDWYKVSIDEYTGFMAKQYVNYSPTVKKVDKERAYLLDSGVNFREGPSTECLSMGKLSKYAPVYITGETDEWYRVIYNEKVGYISRDFVEKGKLEVYVNSQDVNLRAGPGTDTDLLTKVRKNSKFEITGSSGEWLKGIVNHNTGYIRNDYLSSTTVDNGKRYNEFTDAEIALAAKVVYLEARDNGTEAYRAVANVLYNRVKSHRFPDTIKGVVYQSGQFSVIHHSNFDNLRPSSQAYNAARDVLNGGIRPLPFNVLFFHASYLGRNWGNDKSYYKTVGDNTFFRYVG